MNYKKYHAVRVTLMSIFLFISAGFFTCVILAIFNTNNDELRNILLPIIISYVSLMLILIIFFGRIFCGFICPVGFLGDIISKLTELFHLPRLKRNSHFMKIINIFSKIFLVFFCLVVTTIIVLLFLPDLLAKISFPIFILFVVASVIVTFNFLARRFFCNLCPVGSLIGIIYKTNIVKMKKDTNKCIYCGACYNSCPMRIQDLLKEKKNLSNSLCIFCGECIKKCPIDDALILNIKNKTIIKSSKKDFLANQFAEVRIKKENK